ncbi:MAG: PepSY-like domain-containing protein [Bacteroidales bacterium]
MKLKIYLFAIAMGGLFSFTSCDEDDNATHFVPSEQVINAFKKDFPNATNIRWEQKKGYSVASFYLPVNTRKADRDNHEAWYEAGGECALTEWEIDRFDQLPMAVQEGYHASEFGIANWKIDDMDALKRAGMELIYKIEVEKDGQPDYDLIFAENGTLISAKIDKDDDDDDNVPVIIPGAILDFVNTHFKDARLLDLEWEHNEWQLEMMQENKEVEVFFDSSFKFLRMEEEYTETELPEAVKTALLEYKSQWEIDDIIRIMTADQEEIFAIEMENKITDREQTIRFRADGSVIAK